MTNVGGIFIALGMGVAIAFLLSIVDFLWNVRSVSIEEHVRSIFFTIIICLPII